MLQDRQLTCNEVANQPSQVVFADPADKGKQVNEIIDDILERGRDFSKEFADSGFFLNEEVRIRY